MGIYRPTTKVLKKEAARLLGLSQMTAIIYGDSEMLAIRDRLDDWLDRCNETGKRAKYDLLTGGLFSLKDDLTRLARLAQEQTLWE